jgi:hypothetical protein
MAAILQMAGNRRDGFEFQRLHGMGEALHEMVRRGPRHRLPHLCPGGAAPRPPGLPRAAASGKRGEQLLREPGARRLHPAATVAAIRSTPRLGRRIRVSSRPGPVPPERANSRGIDLHDRTAWAEVARPRRLRRDRVVRHTDPCRGAGGRDGGTGHEPRAPGRQGGTVTLTAPADVERAIAAAPPVVRPRADRAACPDAVPPISTRPTRPRSSPCSRGRRARPPPMPWPNCARRSISCATTPPARRSLPIPLAGHRLHQPVEFPARHLHRPDRRRAGRRKRGAGQTGGGDPAHRRAGHGAPARRGRPAHGAAASARARIGHRRGALPPIPVSTASPSPAPPRRRRRSTAPWPPTSPPTPR